MRRFVIFDWLNRAIALIGSVVRDFYRAESTTQAGRANVVLMLFALILAFFLAIPPWIAGLVHIFRPGAEAPATFLQPFIAFLVAVLLCVLILGYLESARRRR